MLDILCGPIPFVLRFSFSTAMEKPRANVAKPIQLDTQMELEQSGSSQSQIVLGLPSLQETVDTQMESEHSSSSHIILGLPSAQKTGESSYSWCLKFLHELLTFLLLSLFGSY